MATIEHNTILLLCVVFFFFLVATKSLIATLFKLTTDENKHPNGRKENQIMRINPKLRQNPILLLYEYIRFSDPL